MILCNRIYIEKKENKRDFFQNIEGKVPFFFEKQGELYSIYKKRKEKNNLWWNLIIAFYTVCDYNSIYKLTQKKCISYLGGREQ